MLETLTADAFTALVGDRFTLTDGNLRVPVELVSVTRLGASSTAPGGRREAFSLVFRGPLGLTAPQRIYALEHEALGSHDLFFVPIKPEDDGAYLEAVFT